MTKLKYKDENGFWQELQVGTNVVANPTLTGTEQELTSLQVGNAKYKMPAGGKLYKHYIMLTKEESIVYFYVFSMRSTSYTFQEVQNLFINQVAVYEGGDGEGTISYIFTGNSIILKGVIVGSDTQPLVISKSYPSMNFRDTVTEL